MEPPRACNKEIAKNRDDDENRDDFDGPPSDRRSVSPVQSRSSSAPSRINADACFSKLADTFLTPQETERCRPYLFDSSKLRLTGLIGGSIYCEVYAGLMHNTPVAVKRLRPQIQSATVPKNHMNEISFMSRSVHHQTCRLDFLSMRLC